MLQVINSAMRTQYNRGTGSSDWILVSDLVDTDRVKFLLGQTVTVPPCVYMGPAELDEFLNG